MEEIDLLKKWFPFIKISAVFNAFIPFICINGIKAYVCCYNAETGFWTIWNYYHAMTYSIMELCDVLIEVLLYKKIY